MAPTLPVVATIIIPDELYQRLLALGCATSDFYTTALEEALRRRTLTEKKLGRPAPAVPKAKRSLYLDVQVWFALKVLAQKTEDGSVSSIANQLLRQALSLDT